MITKAGKCEILAQGGPSGLHHVRRLDPGPPIFLTARNAFEAVIMAKRLNELQAPKLEPVEDLGFMPAAPLADVIKAPEAPPMEGVVVTEGRHQDPERGGQQSQTHGVQMRYCEAGACTEQANYRVKKDHGMAGNPMNLAVCEVHRGLLGLVESDLVHLHDGPTVVKVEIIKGSGIVVGPPKPLDLWP